MQQIGSLLQALLLSQNVSGTIIPIIRSSRVLYRRLLLQAATACTVIPRLTSDPADEFFG